MATVPQSWLDDAFTSAKEDFKRSLKNPALCDFSKLTSIDDVFEEAKKIERQQAKTKTLRGLRRVQPLINGLKEYSAIIEQFVQAKPEIMSLIWGPLKFILHASSSVILAFERVVKVIADVGMTLPSFKVYTQLFQSNHEIRRALCLFFADILDFYAILLNFLTNPRRNIIIESLWPNIRSSITKIQENMDHHKAIMTTNVTLQDILLAHQARKRALEEYDQAQTFRDNQNFSIIRNEFNPHDHDTELSSILRRSSVTSGEWLKDEPDFMRWRDPVYRTARIMWLYGIPGSGKTFIVGNLIRTMQISGQRAVFAFLSHNNQVASDTIKVLHSFLFQLLENDPSLRPLLHEASQSNYRKLKSDPDFVMDLLRKILEGLGPTFIILDGLDEVDEYSWGHLLASVLKINESCPETKLLISSREERGIALRLKNRAVPVRVDHKNSKDIESFIKLECENLLLEMRGYGVDDQTCLKIEDRISNIPERAAGKSAVLGMFIYARLVMLMVKDQGNPHDIEAQIKDLPDGLDEVYGRLLDRLKTKSSRTVQVIVRKILQWVACAQKPLREEELLQILAIEPGQQDFAKGRKQFRDICKMCGPIIEINNDNVQFVHFSAKEYLLHEQSDSFLNLYEAHIDATLTCTTYLSFSSLNSLFSLQSNVMADIPKRIMDGDYVLFEYASIEFLEHLKALGNQSGALDTRLVMALNRLREIRSSGSLNISCVPKHVVHMFRKFADEPKVHAFLSIVMYFQTKAQLGMPNQDDNMNCPNDPLRALSARRKVRQVLEDMICQRSDHRTGCRCDDLKRLYGTNLYCCDQPFCYAYRCGFGSKQSRDQHLKIHQRPHKCSATNCLFADIGFCDTIELQRHTHAAHPSQTPEKTITGSGLSPARPLDDSFNIVKDAIALNHIELVRELLIKHIAFEEYQRGQILTTAAWKASEGLFSYLLDWDRQCGGRRSYDYLLAVALETENLPNIGFLLSRGADMSVPVDLTTGSSFAAPRSKHFNMSGYLRALSLWSPTLMAYLIDECHIDFPQEIEQPEWIFACAAIQNDTLDQARKRFEGIKQYIIWPEAYEKGIGAATQSRCFLGAMICLENGGNPNGISGDRTALYSAVKAGNQYGAQLAKMLLQHGADPEHPQCGVQKNSAKAKKIAGYFGLTWEEMVRRIRAGEDVAIISRRTKRDVSAF
ncbi:uncharacterized protein F4807DRAFT_459295 [Annulohypoxylon truncatum]|uniref:uncharacterized protein n=1 Tax=Annulohypoxylon truncatum TaxID=327061 RepID=UPI002007DD9A|nr:uncharacterized protein F4807DRAFT_459295 [Annulohypoxylon truncatum]KAI1211064.1 hypothetical protein F4807DRAFT_459295 [Annulohypoxylon truncatum]